MYVVVVLMCMVMNTKVTLDVVLVSMCMERCMHTCTTLFRILLDYNMFLERSDLQGLGLEISQLARNLLCNTSTDIVMALTVIAMHVIMCAALSLTK